ncbi:hypothetical protein ELH79_14805 [Rhizobium leguminosarum]|nr:hypothetical protein ELH79_14805 [Rhizobium leguminosarum]TAZ10542.1 hypothetical protein ELH78_15690 [Rhizobium leguminosarum]
MTLVVSDIPGDVLSDVASGPRRQLCFRVVQGRFSLMRKLPRLWVATTRSCQGSGVQCPAAVPTSVS